MKSVKARKMPDRKHAWKRPLLPLRQQLEEKGALSLPSTAVNYFLYFFCGSFYQRYSSTLPDNKRTKPTWKKEVQSCQELVRYSEWGGALRDFGRCGLTKFGFMRWMNILSSLGASMTLMNGKLHSQIGWVANDGLSPMEEWTQNKIPMGGIILMLNDWVTDDYMNIGKIIRGSRQ